MTSLSVKYAGGSTDNTFQKKLDKAIELHKEGNEGNKAAVQEANRLLEQLRHDHPGHPLADAYHGAVMNLIARYSTKPFERLRYSKRGLKLLDEAVAADPNHPKIRLLRGKVAYAVPENHFHRTATAIEDYKFLIDHSMRENGALTKEDSKLVYELGEAYHRIGRNQDAANCWRKLENDPEYGQIAKQKLQSVAGRPAIEDVKSSGGLGLSDFLGVAALATGKALLKWVERQEKKARKKRKKKERRRRKHKH